MPFRSKVCQFAGWIYIQQHTEAFLWPCSLNVLLISSLVAMMFSMWHFGWEGNYATQIHNVTEQCPDSKFTKDELALQIQMFSLLLLWQETKIVSKTCSRLINPGMSCWSFLNSFLIITLRRRFVDNFHVCFVAKSSSSIGACSQLVNYKANWESCFVWKTIFHYQQLWNLLIIILFI